MSKDRAQGGCIAEVKLRRLRHRTKVHFDASRPKHQNALRALWYATYPGQELQSLVSDQWKEMGWQGKDPSTDFRGAGFISLENLLFFAKTVSTSFQSLLRKKTSKRVVFQQMLSANKWAFDLLYCVAFMIMDKLWLDKNSTYMQFDVSTLTKGVFSKSTKTSCFYNLYKIAYRITFIKKL